MLKITRLQKKLLLHLGIGSVFLLAFLFILIVPKQAKVKELHKEVDVSTADYERIQRVILAAHRSGERFQNILKQLDDYHRMAPPAEVLPQLLSQIAAVAQRNGLEVILLEPKEKTVFLHGDKKPFEEAGRLIEEHTIQMDARGSFFVLGHFMSLLENAPYKILIKKVVLENPDYKDQGARGSRNLIAKISFSVLTRSQPSQTA